MHEWRLSVHQTEGEYQPGDNDRYKSQECGAFGVENRHIVKNALANRFHSRIGIDAYFVKEALLLRRYA